uniref:Uncharacterized protein n=1 Tax=Oryza punctata TaxID=4537 RepID=A0A0E0JXQ5_ORYPU
MAQKQRRLAQPNGPSCQPNLPPPPRRRPDSAIPSSPIPAVTSGRRGGSPTSGARVSAYYQLCT